MNTICSTYSSDVPTMDICEEMVNTTMCPSCDKFCDFHKLGVACLMTQAKYLFDNATTVFYAVFMSIWAVIFTEMWRRNSAEITHRWDVFGYGWYSSCHHLYLPSQYFPSRSRGGTPQAGVPGQAHRRGGEAHQLRDPDHGAQAALLEDEDAGSPDILGQCPLLRHPRPGHRGRHHPLQDVHDRGPGHSHRQVNQV